MGKPRLWKLEFENDIEAARRGAFLEAGALTRIYFFRLLTASFSCFPALNLTALVAGILIRSAV